MRQLGQEQSHSRRPGALGALFSLLGERNRYLLWQELDAASKDPKTPLQKKYGDFYRRLHEHRPDRARRAWSRSSPHSTASPALKDAKSLATLIGDLAEQGDPAPLFRFGVQQDEKDSPRSRSPASARAGFRCPIATTTSSDTKRFQTIRQQYREHVTKMFTLAGDSPEQAAKEADAVIDDRNRAGQGFHQPHRTARSGKSLSHLYRCRLPEARRPISISPCTSKMSRCRPFDTLNVATPDFFKALNELIASQPVDAWKSYLRWHVIHGSAGNLPKAFHDENFDFFGRLSPGRRNRLRAGSSAPPKPTARWAKPSDRTG